MLYCVILLFKNLIYVNRNYYYSLRILFIFNYYFSYYNINKIVHYYSIADEHITIW